MAKATTTAYAVITDDNDILSYEVHDDEATLIKHMEDAGMSWAKWKDQGYRIARVKIEEIS